MNPQDEKSLDLMQATWQDQSNRITKIQNETAISIMGKKVVISELTELLKHLEACQEIVYQMFNKKENQ